jgi:hypothetical protein
MKYEYNTPEISIVMLETEQCIMSGSNVPGFEPGTDLDELSY